MKLSCAANWSVSRRTGARCRLEVRYLRTSALTSETAPVRFSDLFGGKPDLLIYSMMYGPDRKAPCPMCTSFLNSFNGIAVKPAQRAAIAVTARSPIEAPDRL
jgi:predicted dithiol-disulfide oxidoreductase (DUF899 family)